MSQVPDGGDRRELQDRREELDEEAESNRKYRLVAGGVSALPIAIIVSWLYGELMGHQMDQQVALAIASLMGSLSTGIVLCYKDMRAILAAWVLHRRSDEKR